jgi:hypothetical protein
MNGYIGGSEGNYREERERENIQRETEEKKRKKSTFHSNHSLSLSPLSLLSLSPLLYPSLSFSSLPLSKPLERVFTIPSTLYSSTIGAMTSTRRPQISNTFSTARNPGEEEEERDGGRE